MTKCIFLPLTGESGLKNEVKIKSKILAIHQSAIRCYPGGPTFIISDARTSHAKNGVCIQVRIAVSKDVRDKRLESFLSNPEMNMSGSRRRLLCYANQ